MREEGAGMGEEKCAEGVEDWKPDWGEGGGGEGGVVEEEESC